MKLVFEDLGRFIVLMNHSDVYIFRSGDYCDGDIQTKSIPLLLAHGHVVMISNKKVNSSSAICIRTQYDY